MPSGNRLHTFRRGTRRGKIRCLSFDSSGMYLCAGSASGTIHFYKNVNSDKESSYERGGDDSKLSSSSNNGRTGYIASYISSFMPENLDTTRSFAQVRLRMYTSWHAFCGALRLLTSSYFVTAIYTGTSDSHGGPPYHCAIICDAKHTKRQDEFSEHKFFVTVVSVSGIFSLYSVNKRTGETLLEEENALFETQSDALDAKLMLD